MNNCLQKWPAEGGCLAAKWANASSHSHLRVADFIPSRLQVASTTRCIDRRSVMPSGTKEGIYVILIPSTRLWRCLKRWANLCKSVDCINVRFSIVEGWPYCLEERDVVIMFSLVNL